MFGARHVVVGIWGEEKVGVAVEEFGPVTPWAVLAGAFLPGAAACTEQAVGVSAEVLGFDGLQVGQRLGGELPVAIADYPAAQVARCDQDRGHGNVAICTCGNCACFGP